VTVLVTGEYLVTRWGTVACIYQDSPTVVSEVLRTSACECCSWTTAVHYWVLSLCFCTF